MRLELLRVLHYSKKGSSGEVPALGALFDCAFHLNSCQRLLWVTNEDSLGDVVGLEGVEILVGSQAYQFLLRVACGLESEIAGETDIFGQIKDAWKVCSLPSPIRAALHPWMQRLFEDTKEIRARFLQSVGGGSYGTLVRKVLHEDGVSGPILLLGAGALAHSVAPFLLSEGVELWIANRTQDKAETLRASLLARSEGATASVRVVEEQIAFRDAGHVVICVPTDESADSVRASAYRGQSLLHLGGMRKNCAAFVGCAGFRALDDLFEIQKRQGQARSLQLAAAGRACIERAKLRTLGNSVSIAHGWEDLAIFAS